LPLALALAALGGCRSAGEVAPSGAFLLKVSLAPGAQVPDELRASVYDDTGALWNDVRFPASGALVAESATELGTILIQPGTVAGDLRIDLRGLVGGVLVDEGTSKIPHASFSGGTFDLALSGTLPSDGDGDGVPDAIDDCPALADPTQTGCPGDGGAADATAERHDAAADAPPVHDAGTDKPRVRDAGTDVPHGNKGTGSGCAGAGECASGFCTDGVCCNNACDNPCQSCATGTCTTVKSGEDVPECVAPMTCNKTGKCVAASAGSQG
jgi:hypothetical protein